MFTDFIAKCRAVKITLGLATPDAVRETVVPRVSVAKARRVAVTA